MNLGGEWLETKNIVGLLNKRHNTSFQAPSVKYLSVFAYLHLIIE